jgi:hypothetical protein
MAASRGTLSPRVTQHPGSSCHAAGSGSTTLVRARRQFQRAVGAEGEPVAIGAKLGIKRAFRTQPDASETGCSTAARRHPGEKEKKNR